MPEQPCVDSGAAAPPVSLLEQLRSGAADWMDPRIPELLCWMRAGQRRSELHDLLRQSATSLGTIDAARAGELSEVLATLGDLEQAYTLSALPPLAADASLAVRRARLAMQLRDYRAAVAASDVAIAALLQPGLSVAEFLHRCSTGAPAEGMLRFERQVLAERASLSERLALRWEALHRAGMTREASLMQLMCQRYFPERASVWATSGNHALDADDIATAERYFQRCLQLDAAWTAGLAGMAIVCERRKDWASALPYRRQVLELEQALASDDSASLQRRIRYAAALARLGRWGEAEPLFRAAVRCGAFQQLPAERTLLLRVFSQALYAPSLVAEMLRVAPPSAAGDSADAAVTLAQHEAWLLGRVARRLHTDLERSQNREPERTSRWALALCAYLAGELERSYELLDALEDERPRDLALQCLLWRCARAIGHAETESIGRFAAEAARAVWTQLKAADLATDTAEQREQRGQQLQYAVAILPELEPELPALASQLAVRLPDAAAELRAVESSIEAQLERVAVFRAAHEGAGTSPLAAAASSTHALAAAAASSR